MKRQIASSLIIALMTICAVASQYVGNLTVSPYQPGEQITSFKGDQLQLMADPGGATGGNGGG